uniref:Uncharacterized protein n=1 Tax=Rhizophora mucronata TaxID=61149 RepID=A0A2P2PBL4_RHIMU
MAGISTSQNSVVLCLYPYKLPLK